MAEWPNVSVLKTEGPLRGPWARILFLPIFRRSFMQNTTTLTALQTIYAPGLNGVRSFWAGFLGGSALIAAGKLWSVLTNQAKVSELLGHLGTPLFRRQLATGAAVYGFSIVMFNLIGQKYGLMNDGTLSGNIFIISTRAVAGALGCGAAVAIPYSGYQTLFYTVSILTVLATLAYLKSLRDQRNDCEGRL